MFRILLGDFNFHDYIIVTLLGYLLQIYINQQLQNLK